MHTSLQIYLVLNFKRLNVQTSFKTMICFLTSHCTHLFYSIVKKFIDGCIFLYINTFDLQHHNLSSRSILASGSLEADIGIF